MNRIQKGDYAQNLWRGEGEIRLEEEISLPDYCSDIIRLMRVEAHGVVDRCRAFIQDSAVMSEVSGTVYFTAVYLDEEGESNSYSFSRDFSGNYKKDIGAAAPIADSIYVCAMPTQISCNPKVLSQRRLLARCEMKMALDVFSNVSYSAYNAVEDMESGTVDAEKEEKLLTRIVSNKTEGFSLREEIKLPATLPSGAKVLSTSASIEVGAVYPSVDEVSLEGVVNFRILYLSEEDESREAQCVSFYQPVEFKNTVSVDDCSENSVLRARGWTGNPTCEIAPDSFGENRIFSLSVPYTLSCLVMENVENTFVVDAYGVGGEVVAETASSAFLEYLGTLSEKTSFREQVPLKDEYDAVEGTAWDVHLKGVGKGDEGYFADLRVNVSALCKKDGALAACAEETFDVRVMLSFPDSIEKKISDSDAFIDTSSFFTLTDCQISRGALDVTGEITTNSQVYKKSDARYIKDLEYKQGEKKKTGVRFYYPSEEDTLWTVGKRYGVSRSAIKEANAVEGATLPAVVRIP